MWVFHIFSKFGLYMLKHFNLFLVKSSSTSKSTSGQSSSSSKISGSTSSSNQNSSSTSSRSVLPPNINIISADKRIQIMKKKAATKLQEKRKPPR